MTFMVTNKNLWRKFHGWIGILHKLVLVFTSSPRFCRAENRENPNPLELITEKLWRSLEIEKVLILSIKFFALELG
jgi:hypothetical protein